MSPVFSISLHTSVRTETKCTVSHCDVSQQELLQQQVEWHTLFAYVIVRSLLVIRAIHTKQTQHVRYYCHLLLLDSDLFLLKFSSPATKQFTRCDNVFFIIRL
jgi:hypothetical protein